MRQMSKDTCNSILEYIDGYINDCGVSPTIAEISKGTDIPYATVGRYLSFMRSRGMIDYSGHRNIQTSNSSKVRTKVVNTPLLGDIACGIPKFAEENIEEYVPLPVSLFGTGEYFLLKASGESMIDVGIEDGNLVLVKKQNYADPGQIVVALLEDEATLKTYYPDIKRKRVRLHPENSTMKDIFVNDCTIQGVAVNVIKNL